MTNLLPSLFIFNTTALVGLLSLLIPFIIHIINRSKGKLVYLGNIEFVKQVKKTRVTEINLTQRILWFLRTLIFSLITLLIAGLGQKSEVNKIEQTQLYFSPLWISTESNSTFNRIMAQYPGAKSFVLAKDFTTISSENFKRLKKQMILDMPTIQSSAIVSEIANRHTQATQIKVYSTNSSAEFSNIRPHGFQQIDWNFIENVDVAVNSFKINVDIYSDNNRQLDTRLLQIVFDQIASQRNQRFEIVFHSTTTLPKSSSKLSCSGWIFWLSDKQPIEEIWQKVKNGCYLLTDNAFSGNSSQTEQKISHSQANISNLAVEFNQVKKLDPLVDYTQNIVWSDNLNTSLLSSKVVASGLHFIFNSRFHPSWNNLVESPKFADILSQLLTMPYLPSQTKNIAVSELKKLPKVTSEHSISENLQHWIVLFIALLWFAERWLSEPRRLD